MKKMKMLIGIIIICIIITVILLFKLIPILQEEQKELENLEYGDVLNICEETTDIGYYIISNCIEEYIQYNIENSKEKLQYILEDKAYGIEKFDTIYYLKINQIYKIERMNDVTYFVEAKINNENSYYVVNVDYITKAYNIRKTIQEEYENAENDNVNNKYRQSIEIELNSYNRINETAFTDFEIVNKYYDVYSKLAINNPEIAFEMIDKQHRLTRFDNDFSNYKEYIDNNKEKIINTAITNVQVEVKDNYKKYYIKNTFEKTYVITEYNYSNFVISLDEVNAKSEEEYLKLSLEERVEYNIKNIFKLLDDKEFKEVYRKLDSKFKNNNFNTLDSFKQYATNTFFDYNMLGKITIEKQGSNYIAKVAYKDGVSSIAEKREKTFIMKLLEGTDFVMSFQVN